MSEPLGSRRAAEHAAQLAAELHHGRRAVALRNAQLVCPTPRKHSFRTPASAYAAAAHVTARTGAEWEPVACYCGRLHIAPAPEPEPTPTEGATP